MVLRSTYDFPRRRWSDLFDQMERMSRQMNQMTSAPFGKPAFWFGQARVFPAVNITEDQDNYYVRAELPGMKADDLYIQVDGKNLMISGERKIDEGDKVKYHRKEREAGKFSRIINLPGDVNSEKVTAGLVNGILNVSIAKQEAAKPKQITIK